MYTRFGLVSKSMTLNDPWARFKVIDSLNAAKMAKFSLVMTSTPCRVAGCIRPTYSCARRSYTYLLTYLLTHSWLCVYKTGNVSETVEDRAKVTINGLHKVIHGLSIAAKMYTCMTLNDLWARFKVIDSLNAAKMTKYSLVMTPTPCRVDGCIISIRPSCTDLVTYLLNYTLARGYKTGNISETVEDRAKVTINGLHKVVHGLSISAKMYDLEWHLREI